MKQFFSEFTGHWAGRWLVNGVSVMAFFILAHLLVMRLRDTGVLGALKSVVLSA